MTDTRREEIAMAIGFASRHKFDASKDAAEFWEYISGEGREWYLRMADAVLPIVTPAPEAGWRGMDSAPKCEQCQEPATKLCQMTTHQCEPMPICEDCAAKHDAISSEINDHEMRHFGGAYGQVTYHYLPLPPTPGEPATEQPSVKEAAVDALASYQQADADGIMVLVSRQAIEECLPALRSLAQGDE